jgi:hypothetical protein
MHACDKNDIEFFLRSLYQYNQALEGAGDRERERSACATAQQTDHWPSVRQRNICTFVA